jgi:hypothetical protein
LDLSGRYEGLFQSPLPREEAKGFGMDLMAHAHRNLQNVIKFQPKFAKALQGYWPTGDDNWLRTQLEACFQAAEAALQAARQAMSQACGVSLDRAPATAVAAAAAEVEAEEEDVVEEGEGLDDDDSQSLDNVLAEMFEEVLLEGGEMDMQLAGGFLDSDDRSQHSPSPEP